MPNFLSKWKFIRYRLKFFLFFTILSTPWPFRKGTYKCYKIFLLTSETETVLVIPRVLHWVWLKWNTHSTHFQCVCRWWILSLIQSQNHVQNASAQCDTRTVSRCLSIKRNSLGASQRQKQKKKTFICLSLLVWKQFCAWEFSFNIIKITAFKLLNKHLLCTQFK